MVIMDEHTLSDSGENVLFQQKPIHTQQYSFSNKEKIELDFICKSKFDLISSYVEKKKQSLD